MEAERGDRLDYRELLLEIKELKRTTNELAGKINSIPPKQESSTDKFIKIATVLALFIPLFAAVLTFANDVGNRWAETERELQLRLAQSVLDANTPSEALNRARAIERLFPGTFPADYEAINFDDIGGGLSPSARIEIVRLRLQALQALKDLGFTNEEIRAAFDMWLDVLGIPDSEGGSEEDSGEDFPDEEPLFGVTPEVGFDS